MEVSQCDAVRMGTGSFRACNAATGHKRRLWDRWNNEYFGFVKTELSCHMN